VNGPWRTSLMAGLVVALVLAGCGAQSGDGGGGDLGDLPDRASATSEDEEGTTYPLAPGRYRLSYRAPGCQPFVISIQQVDGEFSFEQQPRGFVSFVDSLPGGEYTIGTPSECAEWKIDLNQF
jgi:hypothetical protein